MWDSCAPLDFTETSNRRIPLTFSSVRKRTEYQPGSLPFNPFYIVTVWSLSTPPESFGIGSTVGVSASLRVTVYKQRSCQNIGTIGFPKVF